MTRTRLATCLRLAALAAAGTQVVAAADEPLPIDGATNIELGYPGLAARVEIASRIARSLGLHLSATTLRKLPHRHPGTPPTLESAIRRTAAHRSLVS